MNHFPFETLSTAGSQITVNQFHVVVLVNNQAQKTLVKSEGIYVPLVHKSEYSLLLKNSRNVPADADVTIDNESMGKFRIPARSQITIERPVNVSRKFTFLRVDSREAKSVGISGNESSVNGLVSVCFHPRQEERLRYFESKKGAVSKGACGGRRGRGVQLTNDSLCCEEEEEDGAMENYSAGATALGDDSDQKFTNVTPITDVDADNITTIHLRLIALESNRSAFLPLSSNLISARSTAIPPPFEPVK